MTDITQDVLKQLLGYDPETGVFVWKVTRGKGYAGSIAGADNGDGYIRIKVPGKLHYAHRLAWLYVYGEWPERNIDHINGNKSDNRIQNLRLATIGENNWNSKRRLDNTSGFKGVTWASRDRRWKAQIGINGKHIYLGNFLSQAEAYEAYCKAAKELFGDFSNFGK